MKVLTHDQDQVWARLVAVWTAALSGMTIGEWAAVLAMIYTGLQIFVLVRDKIIRHNRKTPNPKENDVA